MTLGDVFLLLIPVLVVALLFQHNRVRLLALQAARRYTQQNSMQLLDQTVMLAKMHCVRGQGQPFTLRRVYRFEFTVRGDRRYRGWVTLLGNRIQRVETEAVAEDDFSVSE